MFWHILLEIVLVLVLVFAGGPFWACLKAPRHLRSMLADPGELRRVIELIGYERLNADAQEIKAPPLGSYGDTIVIWDGAHYTSLSSTRNWLLFIVLVALAASLWMGVWYFAVSLLVFAALGFEQLPAVAKGNNAKHLPSVMLNLIKWRQEDGPACEAFCYEKCPEYRNLYDLLGSLQPRQ